MKMNKTYILSIFVTLVIGLSAGALFFGGEDQSKEFSSVDHDHSEDSDLWTCSMHPQVRQAGPGACPFCGMDLIPVDQGEDSGPRAFQMTESALALANIQTSRVERNRFSKQLALNGRLQYDDRAEHSQTSHFGGRIEKLFKNYEGERVQKGEIIAHIYSPELVAAQEELIQAKKVEASNPLLWASARKKLKYWKLTDEQINSIAASGVPLENFPLLAQFEGIISKKNVNNGDHIMEGQVLYEISDPMRLWAVFEVYERDINKINLGDAVDFKPNGTDESFQANVSFIAPEVDPIKRVVEVRADIFNDNKKLKSQMFIEGTINTNDGASSGLSIPKSSILWTGKRSVVYVKHTDQNIFELREVALGTSDNENVEVISGLNEGEEIVTNGTFTLDAEAQLRGKISMMNTDDDSDTQRPIFSEITLTAFEDHTQETPNAFKRQLSQLTTSYIALKDAMVEGNAKVISNRSFSVKEKLSEVNMALIKGAAHQHWMELLSAMEKSITAISSSTNRDDQRLEFINLSKAMINTLKSFGIDSDEPLFIQYCPMANNDQGANWISLNENIINPYFGDMMLTCGSVEEVINN